MAESLLLKQKRAMEVDRRMEDLLMDHRAVVLMDHRAVDRHQAVSEVPRPEASEEKLRDS